MKLLFCRACDDIFALSSKTERACTCGLTKGAYRRDQITAWYSGEHAVPLGIDNFSFVDALAKQPASGWGERFEAFVVPEICGTFVRRRAGE